MSFKIIQEINKQKKTVLTIIPSAFEQNGVYWFPSSIWSTKKMNSVLKNTFSKPDKAHWEARPCLVKKSNIPTFALAEENEEELLNKNVTEFDDDADADDDSEASFSQAKTKRNAAKFSRSPQVDFNVLLEECFASPVTIPTASEESGGNCHNDALLHDLGVDDNIYLQQQPPASNFVMACVNQTSENANANIENAIPVLLANQAKIIKEIEMMKEIVTTGIAKLLTQGDGLAKIQNRRFEDEKKNLINEAAENFEKILTEVQAQQFEEHLVETAFKCEMIRKTSFLIGKHGRRIGQGWTCCYELVDAIFCRHFLTKCSWTGASKNCEEGKIKFLKFKNILYLFAEVTTDADPEFSLEKTKDFFKKLLRNSTRFENQEVLQTRKSTQRERIPRKNLKKTNVERSITAEVNPGTSQENSNNNNTVLNLT